MARRRLGGLATSVQRLHLGRLRIESLFPLSVHREGARHGAFVPVFGRCARQRRCIECIWRCVADAHASVAVVPRAEHDRARRAWPDLRRRCAGLAASADRAHARCAAYRLRLCADRARRRHRLAAAKLGKTGVDAAGGVHAGVGRAAQASRRGGGAVDGSYLAGVWRDRGDTRRHVGAVCLPARRPWRPAAPPRRTSRRACCLRYHCR